MTQNAFDMSAESPGAESTLLARLTPSGHVALYPGPDEGPALPEPVYKRIHKAFATSQGRGLLHLGAAELDTKLHPTLAYWRDLGRTFVTRACSTLDPDEPQDAIIPNPEDTELEGYAEAVPPMPGAEIVDAELLCDLWSEMGTALISEAKRHKGRRAGVPETTQPGVARSRSGLPSSR